jgi:hypothetical protein
MVHIDKILSVVVTGLALLMFILLVILAKINRKKIVFPLIISVVYTFFAGYYLYLSYFIKTPLSIMETEIITPEETVQDILPEPPVIETLQPDFWVVIQAGENILEVAPEDEIEIKKRGRFKIKEVKYSQTKSDDIKADLKGFAGNKRFNDGQDIGYWITYDRIMQHWAIEGEKDKFEIIIKKDKEPIGSIYVKFID